MTILTTIIAYLFVLTPSLPQPYCDVKGERARPYSKSERQETRERVQEVCKHVQASKAVCSYLDAIVIRESSGRAGVRHTIGTPEHGISENGLGAMGLSIRWHADKWPGGDEDPMFCIPEVSALVALDIVHRAVKKWEARNLTEVQAVYGGQFGCWKRAVPVGPWGRIYNRVAGVLAMFDLRVSMLEASTVRECNLNVTARTVKVCKRLERYDVNCWDPVGEGDIGELPPMNERRELAARLHAEYESKDEAQ